MNKMEKLTAQKQLLISEVQWDPENKQWQVIGQQQYDGVQENANDPWKRVRHRRREKVEDKTLIEQRLLENGANKMKKNSAGGLDNLLMFADSAELLSGYINYPEAKDSLCRVSNPNVHQFRDGLSTPAPSGEKRKEKPLDMSGGLRDVKAEKKALSLNGRIRLTHLRHYARARNHQPAQQSGPKGSFLVSNPNVHQLQDGLSTPAPSGEKLKKKPLDASGGLHYVGAEKNALPLNGRIRMTHLRHYARTRNHQLA
ncbi:hypothetical protein MKX01_018328 [Papaver californicum]|nr:hypothetical protein MKX01_016796 [Papaver californicum]KAI3992829.1 hypothetical protein MKX01_018328 [Papaver californicum]